MAAMRAARFHAAGDIRVEEIPVPKIAEGQILVDVEWCGICGSDVHEYLIGPNLVPTKEHPHPISGEHIPLPFGHELCGRVRSPPPGSRFKDSEAVVVDPRIMCKSCVACKAGESHCCRAWGYIGGTTPFGGYGEQVTVEGNMLLSLPPSIPIEYAALIEPLAVVWHAIKGTEITEWKDKHVLVLGGGPIGFALSLCLKAQGANKVIVSEPTEARRKQIAEFAASVLNPITEDVGQKCQDLTGGVGVEVVFDCAGVPAGLEAGFDALKYEGMYMMIAVWEKPLVIPSFKFLVKHLTMRGTAIMADGDFAEVMEMMAGGKLEGYEKMVTGRIQLEDIVPKGFEELIQNKDKHIKILVSPKSMH